MSLIVINELSSRVRYHTLKIATTRILVSSSECVPNNRALQSLHGCR